jgi:hypothetical protein
MGVPARPGWVAERGGQPLTHAASRSTGRLRRSGPRRRKRAGQMRQEEGTTRVEYPPLDERHLRVCRSRTKCLPGRDRLRRGRADGGRLLSGSGRRERRFGWLRSRRCGKALEPPGQ